ncbi:MAG: hypothetical protein K2H45_09515 [Acetatifactor sp.]|nr:hypothetical protein [Acetatifactor sp.]
MSIVHRGQTRDLEFLLEEAACFRDRLILRGETKAADWNEGQRLRRLDSADFAIYMSECVTSGDFYCLYR